MNPYAFTRTVQEHYVERVRAIMAARRERLRGLRTRAQAEAYVRDIRGKVKRCFGPMPERTPLNAVVTGRDVYPRYTLEKVVFESRPAFFVTGNLYLPANRAPGERRPGVIEMCGHAGPGKALDLYQSAAQGLAIKGFVVLLIDPIEQGERRQFFPADGGRRPGLCHAHNLMGNQQVLLDDFFGSWRVWDAMRALDYLCSRPEVDRGRLGATGNSGGGTLTTWLTALDPRLTMAAPSCYICSILANLENEVPSDAEQNPPGLLAAGLDQADLLLCHAPRPTIVLSKHNDFFDVRAAAESVRDMQHVHRLLGATGTVEHFVGPGDHGFSVENRQAMYGFFLKHAGMDGTPRERGVRPAPETALRAAPRGQVRSLGSRRVFEFTAARAADVAARRKPLAPDALRGRAAALLGIRLGDKPPAYRALVHARPGPGAFPFHGRYAVETDPGIQCVVTSYGPRHPGMHPPSGRVTLYVGHVSADDDVARVSGVRRLARGRRPFVTVDPRGIGMGMAATCGSTEFFSAYGSDYLYACTGEMLGESYLGRRVRDVLRTIDFLLASGATEVSLIGRGLGSISVAFAALLHPSRPQARLVNYLPSYELIARSPQYAWPLSSLLRGCLLHFDLPDVYAALGSRLTRSQPWDEWMKPAGGTRGQRRAVVP